MIKGIVLQPYEVKGSSIFYAFSYYFDRAVESGLIGEESPSTATIFPTNDQHFPQNRYSNWTFVFLSPQMPVEVVRLKSGILRREPRKVRVACRLLQAWINTAHEGNNLKSYTKPQKLHTQL